MGTTPTGAVADPMAMGAAGTTATPAA
jgi:hypothetical protein